MATQKNVFSTFKSVLGGDPPKKPIMSQVTELNLDDQPEPMYPREVNLSSDRTTLQNNAGDDVEGLYPPSVYTAMDDQIRPKLAEACRIQFQGTAELKDVIDSNTFSYMLTDSLGVQNLYEAKYKVLDSGTIDVSWTSARMIQDDYYGLQGSASPMLPPTV